MQKNRQVRQEKMNSKVDSISLLSAVANAHASALSCSQLNCLSILGDLGGSWRACMAVNSPKGKDQRPKALNRIDSTQPRSKQCRPHENSKIPPTWISQT
jgi:hypothetical protein